MAQEHQIKISTQSPPDPQHESTSHYNDKLGKTDIDSSAADSLRYSSDTETLDGQQITIPHEIIDSEVVLNTPASFLSMTSRKQR